MKMKMKITLPHNTNFDFLKHYPKATLGKLLAVYELIEAELPLAIDNPDIVEIELSKFRSKDLTDAEVLRLLYVLQEDVSLGFLRGWETIPESAENSEPFLRIRLDLKEIERFYRLGDALRATWEQKNPSQTAQQLPNKKQEQIKLFLDSEGNLWKEPKERYCYQMLKERGRHKLLKFFMEKREETKDFVRTAEIADTFERNPQGVRVEIGKINAKALNLLKVGHRRKEGIVDGLLVGKQDSGYRLNPRITIKFVN